MARLSISLLGPFHARLDEKSIAGFRSDKARALLAYLAVETERHHSRHSLAGLLWPDRPESAALTNLRIELSHLRQLIGDQHASPPFLNVTREAIQFNRASDHWLDVAEFCALAQNRRDGQPAVQGLEAAIRLYRGSFLQGFALKDSAGFDDWCLLTHERLLRAALEACRRLANHYEREGEFERACEVARRALELEPSHEEAHRQLMRLLALSGRRSEALKQYEACRRLLAEEVGVEPADDTRELYHAILSGRDTPAERRVLAHNLPAQVAPLVGREVELAAIADRLGSSACRLLTLMGPGGCGKTRLALEAAAGQVDHFVDGVFFVPLAPVRSVGAMVSAIAEAVGLAPPGGNDPQRDARRYLLDYLRSKQMLLVLDSFEHLLDHSNPEARSSEAEDPRAQELPGQILSAAPRVTLLVTSRARLNLADEHLLPISGLDCPQSREEAAQHSSLAPMGGARDEPAVTPKSLQHFGAVALFLRATLRVRPDFVPVADDLREIVRICHLVQGMPLPLLLAASWTAHLTPAEIATQLTEHSLDFLEADGSLMPERQRSMRATFDYSWRLLGERERAVLMGLSAFHGGCATHAAAQITGASLYDLRALADRSLLQRGAVGRWEMHELLREYAAEQLGRADRGDIIRDRHAAYYTAATEGWREGLRGPRQGEVSAEMAPDLANVQAAWNWAVQRGSVEWLGRMLDGLCSFYEHSARFREGAMACQSAAAALETQPDDCKRLLARVLTWQAIFDWMLGRMKPAIALLRRSLELLEPLRLSGRDVRSEEAAARLALARLLHYAGSQDRSWELCEQSLTLYQALDDRRGTAQALCWMGTTALDAGHCDAARTLLEESLAIQRTLGDQAEVASTLKYLVQVDCHDGEFGHAEGLARECVAIARSARSQAAIADAILRMAVVQAYEGAFAEAYELLGEAVALCEHMGAEELLAAVHDIRSWMKINLGEYAAAQPLKEANLARFRQIGDVGGVGIELLGLGEIALAEGRLADALPLLTESADLLGTFGYPNEHALALAHQADALSLLGQPGQAREHLGRALQTASTTQLFAASLSSVVAAAVCLAGEGQAERAVELYSLAARHPYVGNSRFRDDVAGKRIAATAASLPPETVAAAQARGRARDLRLTVAELVDEFGRADRNECGDLSLTDDVWSQSPSVEAAEEIW